MVSIERRAETLKQKRMEMSRCKRQGAVRGHYMAIILGQSCTQPQPQMGLIPISRKGKIEVSCLPRLPLYISAGS